MALNRRYCTTPGPRLLVFVSLALGLAPGLTLADHENSAPPFLPIVAQLSLAPASPRYPGDAVTMIASTDPAVPGVAYQFLWDDSIIQPWSEAMSCPWVLPEAIGEHRLTVQLRTLDGLVQEATQTLYVYRRPVEPSDDDPSAD